jgi:hypothetical protein
MTQYADVTIGTLTIGFAKVETDATERTAGLASPELLAFPSPAAPLKVQTTCPCRLEELPTATVMSRHGAAWCLGVKVCVFHGCLRAA